MLTHTIVLPSATTPYFRRCRMPQSPPKKAPRHGQPPTMTCNVTSATLETLSTDAAPTQTKRSTAAATAKKRLSRTFTLSSVEGVPTLAPSASASAGVRTPFPGFRGGRFSEYRSSSEAKAAAGLRRNNPSFTHALYNRNIIVNREFPTSLRPRVRNPRSSTKIDNKKYTGQEVG